MKTDLCVSHPDHGQRKPITLPSSLRVVAIGGGTGLPVVLRALKARLFPENQTDFNS